MWNLNGDALPTCSTCFKSPKCCHEYIVDRVFLQPKFNLKVLNIVLGMFWGSQHSEVWVLGYQKKKKEKCWVGSVFNHP